MTSLLAIYDEAATVLEAVADLELDDDLSEEERQNIEARTLAYLDQLAEQEANKIDAVAVFQDQTKSHVQLLKDQEDKLRARRKALERAQERFREYLLQTMQRHGLRKIKGNSRTLFLRNSEFVQITSNPQQLPEHLRETRIEYVPLKKEIKAAIKAGEKVPGAELVSKEGIMIR